MFGPTFIPLHSHISNDIHHAHQHGMEFEKKLNFFNMFNLFIFKIANLTNCISIILHHGTNI
jgi:hypothetical protein